MAAVDDGGRHGRWVHGLASFSYLLQLKTISQCPALTVSAGQLAQPPPLPLASLALDGAPRVRTLPLPSFR
jgi:hypothetical protein